MRQAPFEQRKVTWIAAISATSLTAGLVLMALSPDLERPPSEQADSFSRSAIGHHALVEILRELDIPVLVSRHATARRAGSSLLLLLEPPDIKAAELGRFRHMLDVSPQALLTLPKWEGRSNPNTPGWIAEVDLVDSDQIIRLLDALEIDALLARPAEPTTGWSHSFETDLPGPDLPNPQLLYSRVIEPLIWCDQGILLGSLPFGGDRVGGPPRHLWILSDPDLLSNHGIGRSQNARLAVGVVEAARNSAGDELAVIIDETMHGFKRIPTLWRELLDYPLVLALLQGLLALGAVLWAGMGRFGQPLPVPPAIEPGKRFLIENTAELLKLGGHSPHTLSRYLRSSVREVSRALHAPSGTGSAGSRKWLDRAGEARGIRISLSQLEASVADIIRTKRKEDASVIAVAWRIHEWRTEMLDGARSGT